MKTPHKKTDEKTRAANLTERLIALYWHCEEAETTTGEKLLSFNVQSQVLIKQLKLRGWQGETIRNAVQAIVPRINAEFETRRIYVSRAMEYCRLQHKAIENIIAQQEECPGGLLYLNEQKRAALKREEAELSNKLKDIPDTKLNNWAVERFREAIHNFDCCLRHEYLKLLNKELDISEEKILLQFPECGDVLTNAKHASDYATYIRAKQQMRDSNSTSDIAVVEGILKKYADAYSDAHRKARVSDESLRLSIAIREWKKQHPTDALEYAARMTNPESLTFKRLQEITKHIRYLCRKKTLEAVEKDILRNVGLITKGNAPTPR